MFHNLNKIIQEDEVSRLASLFSKQQSLDNDNTVSQESNTFLYQTQKILKNIISEIDKIALLIKNDDNLLISVKDQKTLRTCFQIITAFGISLCLIPGLGIKLSIRYSSAGLLLQNSFSDDEKYELLKESTEFLYRSYTIPILKSIIVTFHLNDYLSALIQLSFAPLKKPGKYKGYIMTEKCYSQLLEDKKKFSVIYEEFVQTCYQPVLMKELLVLQGDTEPPPPKFVKYIISKEMSKRLISTGGLLSLIRCFVENIDNNTAFEWIKIELICKIISLKHGSLTETEYLNNMCLQVRQILTLNNSQYLVTGVACALTLRKHFNNAESVQKLIEDIFLPFSTETLSKNELPGTIALVAQEIEHKINIFDSVLHMLKMEWPLGLLIQNYGLLFQIGFITKKEETKHKVMNIFVQSLEMLNKDCVNNALCVVLFGANHIGYNIKVEDTEHGTVIKYLSDKNADYPYNDALAFFLKIFNNMTDKTCIKHIFSSALDLFIDFTKRRQEKGNRDLLPLEDEPIIIDDLDQNYAIILQLLTEISTSNKVINILKVNPSIVIQFIDKMLLNDDYSNEECISISLVLLSTLLSNIEHRNAGERYHHLIPVLKKILNNSTSYNKMLCNEVLSQITSGNMVSSSTACSKALNDVFDGLLPVRAHGIIELTKLIDKKDPETLSKKQLIFCLFQEQLKDKDSYIYLSAVNGLASLAVHCAEDVLHVLCKEFLQTSSEHNEVETNIEQKISELRMKIGDIIVKVIKRLGEMAVVYKTLLLNTMLCGCRDEDPLIRTSALSNLAEIAQVLHYRVGTIIYEVLLCVWGVIENDQAVECRRAAVMVITSLFKGLEKDTLIELKDNLLPIYHSLKSIYHSNEEDSVVRLHAQLALEELNQVVRDLLFPEVEMKKNIFLIE